MGNQHGSTGQRPRVVIIGGGYAGTAVAKALDAEFNVVLIERKEFMLHNIAGLRACVRPGWENYVCIPYNKLLKHGVVVRGTAVGLNASEQTVIVQEESSEEVVRYDFLVMATGSINGFPGKLPVNVVSKEWTQELYRSTQRAIQAARNILIVGGGPVGCELAGEIKSTHPSKTVYLVHNTTALCNNTQPPLPDKFKVRLLDQLRNLGVQVLMNDYQINAEIEARFGTKVLEDELFISGTEMVLTTDSGRDFTADLIFRCLGNRRGSDLVDTTWLNAKGQIKVNQHLQVLGRGNERIFACGDINDVPESKMAYYAASQAKVVAKNITRMAQGKMRLSEYSPAKYTSILVPVGPEGGSSVLEGYYVGPFMTAKIKSHELFVPKYWGDLELPNPFNSVIPMQETRFTLVKELDRPGMPLLSSPSNKPTVVIIGGGYAGITAAQELDQTANVVVVEKRDFMLHNIAGLRACVRNGWESFVCIPYTRALNFGRVIRATARHIDPRLRSVIVEDSFTQTELKYDFLVLAMGSANGFPGKLPGSVMERQWTLELYRSTQDAIRASRSILIVGGGPVGCELAGEIRTVYGDKQVTLVHNSSKLCNNAQPPLGEKFSKSLQKQLEDVGVDVVLNDQTIIQQLNTLFGRKDLDEELYIAGQIITVTKQSGQEVTADLIFRCVGNKRSSLEVEPHFLDNHGQLRVDEYLRLAGTDTVFACGDANDVPESKQAYFAALQAKRVAKNIMALAANQRLYRYSPAKSGSMLVPVGEKGGASELQGFYVGPFLTSKIKSAELFVGTYWKQLNFAEPGVDPSSDEVAFLSRSSRQLSTSSRSSSAETLWGVPAEKLKDGKEVVVVGGGYAGVEVAKLLDPYMTVTLIERKEFMLHNISSLRSCIVQGHEMYSCVPYSRLLKRGRVLKGSVVAVAPLLKTVTVVDDISEREISYDFLVLCTGSLNGFPAKMPANVLTKNVTFALYRSCQDAVRVADSVLVVGGGPVAIELVGEIIAMYPGKRIYLVTNASHLLNNTTPAVSTKVKDRLLQSLSTRGVKVIFDDRKVHETLLETFGRKQLEEELFIKGDGLIFTTDSGVNIQVDLIFRCVGNHLNTEIFDPQWKDQDGRLKVNRHLQVQGYNDIFAAGDITDIKESKLAFYAQNHAKVIAKNIRALAAGKTSLSRYRAPTQSSMLVSLGPGDGASELQGVFAGAFITAKLKSNDLLVGKTWSDLGFQRPGVAG